MAKYTYSRYTINKSEEAEILLQQLWQRWPELREKPAATIRQCLRLAAGIADETGASIGMDNFIDEVEF